MRRPANHSYVCRKRARQCLAPTNNHPKFVGATHASPCKPQPRTSKEGEACLAPVNNHAKFVGATHASPCKPQPRMSKEGEACLVPANNHLKFVEGDACVALQTTATYVERGRGNASPLANNHLKFVGATHASPCKPQPRMSKEGASLPRSYEHHDFVKP